MLTQPLPAFLPGTLSITPGSSVDYAELARFHYVAGRPATFAAVRVASYLPPEDGPPRVVGVSVLSWPSALNRSRHRVFDLKSAGFGVRLRWANAHVRTVSRVVVHPQFRCLGLSTALIRAAVDACPTRYVEAIARMGRVHPLFEKAGFTRVEPATADAPLYFWLDRERLGFAERPLVPSPGTPGEG